MKNWFVNLVAKYLGNGFVRKHISSLLASLSVFLIAFGEKAGIPAEHSKNLIEALTEWVLPLVPYFIGLLIDLTPETPKIVKK